jgi:uncharacterized protein
VTTGAEEVIRTLGLQPHPEGGWYRETWCAAPPAGGGRSPGTTIYFLLRPGERAAWHRLDATEVWHHYAGGPLVLRVAEDGGTPVEHRLGPDVAAGERPQAVVPPGAWQSAEPLGEWALVGCTVSPAFEFSGFELAAGDLLPGGRV